MTNDSRPSDQAIADVSTIRRKAANEIQHISAEHDARQNVSAIFIILGALLAAIGVYLVITDPLPQGGRRSIPGTGEIEIPTTRSDRIAPTQPSLQVPILAPRTLTAAKAGTAFEIGFLDDIARTAEANGITRRTIERTLRGITGPTQEVIDRALNQPELTRTAGDYISQRVTADRIETGRRKLIEHSTLLSLIESRYGVDRHILMAIWGIESNYGTETGNRPVIPSLVTLASADPRRQLFWREELMAALSLVDKSELPIDRLVGSWAGAMGHVQMMPGTYQKHAVDFDGDGRRDVIGSISDALASAANYLKVSGWMPGRIWGREVVLPSNFDFALAAPQSLKTVSGWQMSGVRPAAGLIPTDEDPNWQLILPAGANGPAFLASSNFEALLKYNRAVPYALAVGHLADRLAGGSAIVAPWPADDIALSSAEYTELQRLLLTQGFDPGTVDGIVGPKTRDAIRAYQRTRAMTPDGHPSLAIFRKLRDERRN